MWVCRVAGLLAWSCAACAATTLEQVDLFHRGEKGVHTYRIPALVETRRGTLIAIVDARHEGGQDLPAKISLVMRRSFDRGKTWTPVETIRKVDHGGVGDASLLLDHKTGRVWCFFAYGPPGIGWNTAKPGAVTGPETLQVHAMFSGNDGESWSEAVDLSPQIKDPSWHAMFATSGTHLHTRNGRYIVPLVVRDGNRAAASRNAYSDDGGRTWKAGHAVGPGTDESHVVELNDGTILQNMRNGPHRAIARSKDGGVSFGALTHDEALEDPGCNAGITRGKWKGRDVMIFTNAQSRKRENLTVKLSYDEGRTWPVSRTIHAGPSAYSTVIVLKDRSLGVLYEQGESSAYEKITFARFSFDWVMQK